MTTENLIIGENTKYPLKALLTLPEDLSRPCPTVVFVHGSGSSNMDEKIGKLTPFKDLAEGLARHGIASIRYNKRSYSHALKILADRKTVITVKEETIEDALMASRLLKADSRIDPDSIFIIGHSMGGMLAPRIDAEGGNYKGLVIMAGSPFKMEEILLNQSRDMLAELKGFVRKIAEKQTAKLSADFEGLYELSDDEAKAKKFGGGTTLYYFKEMGLRPTADYLRELKKPILILQGHMDCQVKADRDFEAYKEILRGRGNVSFKLYEGLNHAFVKAKSSSIAMAKNEYSPRRDVDKKVVDDIAQWIQANRA